MSSTFGTKSIGEKDWKAHGHNVATNSNTVATKSRPPGPDWTSSLRCIKQDNVIYPNDEPVLRQGMRPFLHKNEQSLEEWAYYRDGSRSGKRCIINGKRQGNVQSINEISVESTIGNRSKVPDPRGGVDSLTAGDKSYAVPEFSKGFHKEGSTLPAVNFSRSNKIVTDTFIPLQPLPQHKSISYKEKEVVRKKNHEVLEVEGLDKWDPAPALTPGVFKH
eukprot:TCONS_00046258-protein